MTVRRSNSGRSLLKRRSAAGGTSAARAVLYLTILWAALGLGAAPLDAQAPPADAGADRVQIDTVLVEGARRQNPDQIALGFGVRPGSSISYRDIQRGIKSLWATGQFRDLRVSARGLEGDPVTLVLTVDEQPVLTSVGFVGMEHVRAGAVQDSTGLRPGQPYSEKAVREAEAYIRAELASEGIPFARVEPRVEPVEGSDTEVSLIFDVTEGNRVTIAQVAFEGNEGLTDRQLIGAISSKPEGFLWYRGGDYDEATLEDDLVTQLPLIYESYGYLDFEVVGDTLIIDPETGKGRLEVRVVEGPQYRMRALEFNGNRRYSTEELDAYFQEEQGGLLASLGIGGNEEKDYFDLADFQADVDRVATLYRNSGYLFAQVRPVIQRHEPETEDGRPEVTVGVDIDEGLLATVRRVDVEGNDFTYDRIIRERIFLLPGDDYSEQRLLQSYQQISSLGFFETPMDLPSILPDPETGDVDITFHVKERQTGSVNFGTAVGGGVGLSGFLGYDQPNLFGQAKEGHLRWDFGRFVNNLTVSFTDPAIRGSRVSGTVSLFNSRNRFFQFNTGQWKRLGGSLRVGFPVPGSLRSRLFVGYSLVRTKYDLREGVDDTSLFGRPDGILSTASIGLTRQTLDHPLFPTVGSKQSINSEFSGGLLGGDGGFSKHLIEGSWWIPVGQLGSGPRPIRFALGLTGRVGALIGDAGDFPFERFWMGGVQFGEQLRGYDETSITPFGFFPEDSRDLNQIDRLGDAYMSITAEYAIRFNDMLSVSMFMDAGNVWSRPSDIDPSGLFRGAGLGVQLVTPFGPLGLDYAYGFDKPIPGWQLHFRLGPGF